MVVIVPFLDSFFPRFIKSSPCLRGTKKARQPAARPALLCFPRRRPPEVAREAPPRCGRNKSAGSADRFRALKTKGCSVAGRQAPPCSPPLRLHKAPHWRFARRRNILIALC